MKRNRRRGPVDLALEDAEGRPLEGSALRRSWSLLPRALHYLRPYRLQSATSIVFTIILSLVALLEPWPLAFVVDTVLGSKPSPGWLPGFLDGSAKLIFFAVFASLLITAVTGGVTVVNEYVTTKVDQHMVLDFRSDLFRHVQRLSLAFHDDSRTGILMYKINNQADSVGQIVVSLPAFAQSLLTLLGMLWVTYRIDATLALVAMAVVPFVYWSTTYYADRIEPQLLEVRGLEGRNLTIVHETMAMLRVVVAFGREKHEYRRFRKQGEKAVDARIKLTVKQTLFQLGVSFITAVGTAAVLGVGAHQVLRGRITAGELLVVISYVAAVYTPLEQLTNSMALFQQQFISFEHALQLLDTMPDVTEKPDAKKKGRAKGKLAFEDVSFSYETREHTLRHISFVVEPGETLALVGPTGAGKSTLASLIPRLYDPREGRVRIDDVDVRNLTLESLRSQFSIVLQEPLLFSGTIAQNIRYGKPGATQEEIVEAAKAANAHDFIMRLPDQYKTKLGERGTKISGGERQRIAVARAFLRDAPILILDEPTSSIDSRTEAVILDALDRLIEGRTTIMIAHRLSTIRGVDQILVLDHGEIVERGTHDDLITKGGLYQHLWEAQTRDRQRASAAREAIFETRAASAVGDRGNGVDLTDELHEGVIDLRRRMHRRSRESTGGDR